MLFASAAFLFVFLPFSLCAYTLTPGRFKKYVLLAVSAAFCVLSNLKTPLAIPVLPLCAVLTHLSGKYIARTGSRLMCALSVMSALTVFAALRILYEYYGAPFIFPLGAAVYLLCCVSFVMDIYRGDASPSTVWDTMIYLMFFPVTAAGPVIKYKDFIVCLASLRQSVDNFADGIRLYATGFIERIAIAAVMLEAYEKIIDISDGSLNLLFGITAAVLVFLGAYFSFAGWTDMACGLSLMFGIRIPRDTAGATVAYSPAAYFSRILTGLGGWLDDYMITPLRTRLSGWGDKYVRALCAALPVLCVGLWIRTTLPVLIVAVLTAAAAVIFTVTGFGGFLDNKKRARPLGWLITFVLVSVFWTACTLASPQELLSMLGSVTLNAGDYRSYYVYISLSGGKYIAVAAFALLFLPLTRGFRNMVVRLPGKKLQKAVESAGVLLLLAVFGFTVLYFMPQFPQYASHAFKYLVF